MKHCLAVLVAVLSALVSHASCVTSTTKSTSFIPTTATCPQDYVLHAGQCVRSKLSHVVAEKTHSCPANYYLTNGRCERTFAKTIYSNPNTTCPVGAVLQNGMCVIEVGSQCPPGYIFDGHHCTENTLVCPPGFYLNNRVCWPIQAPPIQPPMIQQQYPYPCGLQTPPCPQQQPCTNPPCHYPVVTRPSPPIAVNPITPIPPVIMPMPEKEPIVMPPAVNCPEHYYFDGYTCVRNVDETDVVDPIPACPPGFTLNASGACVKPTTTTETIPPHFTCPDGYIMQGNGCYKETVIETQRPCANTTCKEPVVTYPNPVAPAAQLDEVSFTSTINNHVPINVTTNTISTNNSTLTIHLSGSAAGSSGAGDCKTTTSANGVTVVTCLEPQSEPSTMPEVSEPKPEQPRCCEVVSPRICRRSRTNDWKCYHRKSQECGNFCTQSRVYLRPERPVIRPTYTVMPPMRRPSYAAPQHNGMDGWTDYVIWRI